MFSIIIGGSGSGKSEFAESHVVNINKGQLFYVATMQPFDDESHKKIARHRKMRREKNFDTIECQTHLENIWLPQKATVLLECMSNLVANEMYSEEGSGEYTVATVIKGLERLIKIADNVVVVTNNVFSDGIEYDSETMKYIKNIALINNWMGGQADTVVEIVHKIPVYHKKGEDVL